MLLLCCAEGVPVLDYIYSTTVIISTLKFPIMAVLVYSEIRIFGHAFWLRIYSDIRTAHRIWVGCRNLLRGIHLFRVVSLFIVFHMGQWVESVLPTWITQCTYIFMVAGSNPALNTTFLNAPRIRVLAYRYSADRMRAEDWVWPNNPNIRTKENFPNIFGYSEASSSEYTNTDRKHTNLRTGIVSLMLEPSICCTRCTSWS